MLEHVIDKFSGEIAAAIGGAVAGFVIYSIRYLWKRWKAHKAKLQREAASSMIPNLIKRDIGVYRDLTELMVETKADRAFVIQFHNGTYYVNKANQMKMSCTHEIVKDGISREQDNMQDLLISRFPVMINDLLNAEFITICTKDKHDYFSQMLVNQGVGKCILAIVKDENILEGFVGISYIEGDDLCSTIDAEKIGEVVVNYAARVGYMLRSRDD